jgi:hypothetical protein
MKDQSADTTKTLLNAQQDHWEKMFVKNAENVRTEPSYPARKAVELLN